jgi:gamma-glutamylcyclotransferase (GGCT)/AIG2-like uncharacterized protein YtfP
MSRYLHNHAEMVGRASFQGKLYHITWFPGAVLSTDKADRVYGTLFKLKHGDTVFKVLDDYEDFDAKNTESSLFKREIVTANLEDETTLKTWVYLYNQALNGHKQITSGDFLNRN